MIWLTGCNGMLGSELKNQLTKSNISFTATGKEVDITDIGQINSFLQSHDSSANLTGLTAEKGTHPEKIQWIVNCAGYTDVEKAEDEPETAEKVNVNGTENLARSARKIGAKLIHISTDFVFDGNSSKPYSEEIKKNPLCVYGKTKSLGEDIIQKEMTQYYIIRTSWLYGLNPSNFVYKITGRLKEQKKISVVSDQTGSPTSCSDLASVIIKIIETSNKASKLFGKNSAIPYGIYNFSNTGNTSRYEFAEKIYAYCLKNKKLPAGCEISVCTSDQFETKAKRPSYSVLDTSKLQSALKIKIPNWEKSLEKFIQSKDFQI